jgi:hypothetical protein
MEFCPFTPSKNIVEISVETTDLTLSEVIRRFRQILEKIREREDKDSLIILPEIHGDANFVTIFIKDVLKDYTDLNLEDLRINTTTKIVTASGKVVSPPVLTPEQLFEDIEKELPELRRKLIAELEVDIDVSVFRKILNDIRGSEILERMPPRTTTRLENLLEILLSELKDIQEPETFEDDSKSIIKRVKE